MSTPDAGARPATPRGSETFFRAQKRNRRATWRVSALCVFAGFVMGVPLTLVLTPLMYGVTLVGADIVDHFSPLSPEFWQTINGLARLFSRTADYLLNHRGAMDPQDLALGLAVVLVPGMLLAFFLWMGMRLLFRHGGVGGTLASLNAREPNQADLKELQLADVVQEMAIASGLPAPKVMLIDSPGANAAAIGTSPKDARIVISRRLLDDLDRDQLQALLASVMGSIGNGDLSIAFTVTSVFETCGLIVALINSPFGSQSRGALWRIVRYSFSRGTSDVRAAEAAEVAELLSDTLEAGSTDIDSFFDQKKAGLFRKFFRLVFFPLRFTNMAVEITLWFFLSILLGPCMALLWRTRRYLADASAVELTRNPDALAGALQRLSQDTTAVEGGGWASHLFVVDPKGDSSLRGRPSPEQQRQAMQVWMGAASAGGNPAAVSGPTDYLQLRKEMMTTVMAASRGDVQAVARMRTFAQVMGLPAVDLHNMPSMEDIQRARQGDRAAVARIRALHPEAQENQPRHGESGLQTHSFLSFHPPLKKRAQRLARMGASIQAEGRPMSAGIRLFALVLWLIIGPLLALCAAMMLVAITMIIGLNLIFLTVWLAVIHKIFTMVANH